MIILGLLRSIEVWYFTVKMNWQSVVMSVVRKLDSRSIVTNQTAQTQQTGKTF